MCHVIPQINLGIGELELLSDLLAPFKIKNLHLTDSCIYERLIPNQESSPVISINLGDKIGCLINLHTPIDRVYKSAIKAAKSKSIIIQATKKCYKIICPGQEIQLKKLEPLPKETQPKTICTEGKTNIVDDTVLPAETLKSIRGLRYDGCVEILIKRRQIVGFRFGESDHHAYLRFGSYNLDQIETDCFELVVRANYFVPALFKNQVDIKIVHLPYEQTPYWLLIKHPLAGANGGVFEPLVKISEHIRQRTEKEITSELSALAAKG